MTEAIVAGAIAGAVAGAIVSLLLGMRQPRGARWRSSTSSDAAWRFRGSARPVERPDAAAHQHAPQRDSALGFDLFDESAHRVLAVAQEEAARMHHNYIGTEHLLLGLIRGDAGGPAGRALERMGVTLDKARTATQLIVGHLETPAAPSDITLSPRTRRVLELAQDEAKTLGHPRAGAAEICLGLIREGQGIAAGIIESLGVTLEQLRREVMAELDGQRARPNGTGAAFHAVRGPFDLLSDHAKRALALAQQEAIRLNHNYLGTEHLLLGLLAGDTTARSALNGIGVDLVTARAAVEKIVPRVEGESASEITLTPRLQDILTRADLIRRERRSQSTSPAILLLALVTDPAAIATVVLTQLGATPEKVRAAVEDARSSD